MSHTSGSRSTAGGGGGSGGPGSSSTFEGGTSSTFKPSLTLPSPQFETYPGSPAHGTLEERSLSGQDQRFPSPSSQETVAYQTHSQPQPYGQFQLGTGAQSQANSSFSSYDRSSSTSSFSSVGQQISGDMALNFERYSRYDPSTFTSTQSYPNSNGLASLNLAHTPNSAAPATAGNGPLNPGLLSHEPISSGSATDAVSRVTKAFGLRIARSARRGQLPFLVVFFTCVIVFFMALLGVGYVEPPSAALVQSSAAGIISSGDSSFPALGAPIGAANGLSLGPDGKPMTSEERRKAEMKRLEAEWIMKKRPKDGLWMQSQRDQRARRRKPLPNSHEEYLQRVQDNKINGIVGQVLDTPKQE